MSAKGKGSRGGQRRKKRGSPPQIKPVKKASDASIYVGIVLIGMFFVVLAGLVAGGSWWEFFLIYVVVLAWMVNLFTFLAYQGVAMANWKQALARLPLRFAGYGTKAGKPLEAAHGRPGARTAMITCMIVSAAVILILLLVRPIDMGFTTWSLIPR